MRIIMWGLLSSALAGAAFAQAPGGAIDAEAKLFGNRETATNLTLAPAGGRVAFIMPSPQYGTVAVTADLATGKIEPFLGGGKSGEAISWCRFVTDVRLVCSVRATQDINGKLAAFSRLLAVNSDGSDVRELGQKASWYDARVRQFDGDIIDWLPGQGGSVLMAKEFVPETGRTGSNIVREKDGLGVDQVDTRTLKSRQVEPPRRSAVDYLTDGRGTVRILAAAEERNGLLTGRVKYSYRAAGSREWLDLTDFQHSGDLTPLAVDATSDSLYALKPLNGRAALYRIKLDKSLSSQLVASHPKVDIDEVLRSVDGGRVIGYGFAVEKREAVYFDPEYKALHASLSKAIPNLPIIDFRETSADGNRILLHAGADNDPGRYFVFDKSAKRLEEVISSRPELQDRPLAKVRPITVAAADGTSIPAYLTLPPGKAEKGLPAVVLPHGGPSSRDEWGFDWLAQYLASRGYAVLQPNYRGSAGFGDEWLVENGFKSWQVSVGDIAASARWLASQGIADPNRIAVVGWSYGGYAALQAAATEPGLFKSVAAIAPVTDLGMLKEEAEGYVDAHIVRDFVGSGPHIREGSPLQRAESINVPVLLAHGDMDLNVGVRQSVRMESALRRAGAPVQFLRYQKLDHQLDDTSARQEMLAAIGRLLEQSIGR